MLNYTKDTFLNYLKATLPENFTPQELHNAIGDMVMNLMTEDWEDSRESHRKTRHACYFSMEFLMGRSIFNNLLCLGIYDEVEKEVNVGHPNYWGFYGPFEITVDKSNVKTDITGKVEKAPVTLVIDQVKTIEGITEPAKNGYVTYFNNGSFSHEDFNLYLAVKVDYGWGTINVKDLKVPVWGTEHSYEN